MASCPLRPEIQSGGEDSSPPVVGDLNVSVVLWNRLSLCWSLSIERTSPFPQIHNPASRAGTDSSCGFTVLNLGECVLMALFIYFKGGKNEHEGKRSTCCKELTAADRGCWSEAARSVQRADAGSESCRVLNPSAK